MSDMKIYKGRGTPEMFDDYMDFINYVFGFNGNSSDFQKLLPKLYQYDYNPAGNSYVWLEDDKFRSAIGAFDHDISVCGKVLKTRGIGNVAVHPYHRSRGYMKELMEMSTDDMIKDGVVLAVLGGRRQRYRYFSYEKLGEKYTFSINSDNVRHTFGKEFTPVFSFRRIGPEDIEALASIRQLSESMPLYALRHEGKRYYETLISWKQNVHIAMIDGKFAGYVVQKDGDVSEFLIETNYFSHIREFVRDLYKYLGCSTLTLRIPAHLNTYIEQIQDIAEGMEIGSSKSYSVLNYRAVTEAFLLLKSTYTRLPDGKLILDIDGRAGREKIKITVNNGAPKVEYTDEKPDYSFGHIDAMNMIFTPFCAQRNHMPDFVRLWFPLPIFIYSSDTV